MTSKESSEEYYAGDEMATSTWISKYALKTNSGGFYGQEQTPEEMHLRMAIELAKVETRYNPNCPNFDDLSPFGKEFLTGLNGSDIFAYLHRYKYIIPQGSIMTMLGSKTVGSLSNCFVIPPPVDSYGGIFKTDQQIAQLEKRRGGVGTNINTLRPEGTIVLNTASTSTGSHSFMERFSNTTREVAQNGRRGALMLLIDCRHPDVFKFVTKKKDKTKVTGANVSVMLTDEFMRAVEKNREFCCRFPIHMDITAIEFEYATKNILNYIYKDCSFMKIDARELYDLIIEMAWDNAEPGVAFIDRIQSYCPEGVYEDYKPIASNPCGEQWMQAYDACRLLALNFYNVVENAFKKNAEINYNLLYEISYVQQRLADNIVDLEIEHIDRIIAKINHDPEDELTKATELDLWENIKRVAKSSRRTGCGFTALADMLAALGIKYDSAESLTTIREVMRTKMRAELDCTIDLAITRGAFQGWNRDKEFSRFKKDGGLIGENKFYEMIVKEFPKQAERMYKYGRRNVSWSTVAPTGTVSIVALLDKYPNTSAGIEPQFALYYFRSRKVNPLDKDVRVDRVDANGDSWMEHPVVMGGLKEWIDATNNTAKFVGIENLPKEAMEELFKKSPYYKSCANDISWETRIGIQALVQRYTTNAISSTLNLPNSITKETVSEIYFEAWRMGLKGVTIYRDGCREGVLNLESKKKSDEFEYKDAVKRSKEMESELHLVNVKGLKYAVVVGLSDGKPYEIFAFTPKDEIKEGCVGKTIKLKKGHYDFVCGDMTIKDLQDIAVRHDEQVLTRLISGMLRHGAKPQFVMEQIDKCDLEVVSFGKAISRVLKKYCNEEELIKRSKCSNCGSTNIRMQEGCMTCNDCSHSKCG